MKKLAVMCLSLLLTGMVCPYAAYAQGGPCYMKTGKTFNALVSWAKKKDVKSFSSRLSLSNPISEGGLLAFSTQKPDTESPEALKTLDMKKAEIVKEVKTKNSLIWTFFNTHLPSAKYRESARSGVGCVLNGSLSSMWDVSFHIYPDSDGDAWKIIGFGYEKVVKETETETAPVDNTTDETDIPETNSETGDEESGYSEGQEVLVEYNGQWYPAKILEKKDDKYLIHYHDYDSSWDEWVTEDRMKEKE